MTELSNWLLIGLAVAGLALAVPLVGAHGDGVLGPADPGPDGVQAHHGGTAGGGHPGGGYHAGGGQHGGGTAHHAGGADYHANGADHHADGVRLGDGSMTARDDRAHAHEGTLGSHTHDGAARANATGSAPFAGHNAGHGCGH